MLTPRFNLSQDASFVFVDIHAPFIKINEADCYVTEDEFYFHAEPYYLRLHLPGEVLDDENSASQSQYDSEKGQLIIRLSKKTQGQWFDGLDLLTKLLTPKKVQSKTSNHAGVEVVANEDTTYDCDGEENKELDLDEYEFDWFVEQTAQQPVLELNLDSPKYGFARSKSNEVKDVTSVLTSMIDLKDPDNVPEQDRRHLRLHQEKEAFDCEHYLADYFDDKAVKEIISINFEDLIDKDMKFSQKEQDMLASLPRREYLIEKSDLKSVYLGLIDLVYAYAFNYRFTNGIENIESDWTICKLSATLSWFDSFENIKEVAVGCAQRSLCFPLIRNWKLIQRVLIDVQQIFSNGKTNVLKCLLGIYFIISASEARYPLNDLYLKDYCVWVQSSDSNKLKSMAKALERLELSKSDLSFDLEEMEKEASELMFCSDNEEEENVIKELSTTLSNVVHIKEIDSSDSDDNSDTETSESESEDTNSECTNESDNDVRKCLNVDNGDI